MNYIQQLDNMIKIVNKLMWDGTDLVNGYSGELIADTDPKDKYRFRDNVLDGYLLRESTEEWYTTQ